MQWQLMVIKKASGKENGLRKKEKHYVGRGEVPLEKNNTGMWKGKNFGDQKKTIIREKNPKKVQYRWKDRNASYQKKGDGGVSGNKKRREKKGEKREEKDSL